MEDFICPFCDTNKECILLDDNLVKCEECLAIFEWEDDEEPPKQRRTKPRKRTEENLDDGI